MPSELKFEPTERGLGVYTGHIFIGTISVEDGFSTGPRSLTSFVMIPSDTLRAIADKVDDIQGRLTIQDKLVLKALSGKAMMVDIIRNSLIGILTLGEIESSIEKLVKLGEVARISGKHPMYVAFRTASV